MYIFVQCAVHGPRSARADETVIRWRCDLPARGCMVVYSCEEGKRAVYHIRDAFGTGQHLYHRKHIFLFFHFILFFVCVTNCCPPFLSACAYVQAKPKA